MSQGAAISSAVSLGLSYCVCNAANSLCEACLGTTAAGTTGRKRSVLLLTLAIVCAFWFEYHVSSLIVAHHGWFGSIPYVANAWRGSCERYESEELIRICASNAGAYRPLAMATLFFSTMAVASKAQPRFNREAWPAKMMVRRVVSGCFLVLTALCRCFYSLYFAPYSSPAVSSPACIYGLLDWAPPPLSCSNKSFSLTSPTNGTKIGWNERRRPIDTRMAVAICGCGPLLVLQQCFIWRPLLESVYCTITFPAQTICGLSP